MNDSEMKGLEYADLIVPFIACPFGKPAQDCPFIEFWKAYDFEERIYLIHSISYGDLKKLRAYHRNCVIQRKSDQSRDFSPLSNSYQE